MKVVDLYLADSKVGSGLRRYVVLKEGRKWITLFHYPTLATITVATEAYKNATEAADTRPRTLRRIIRRNLAQAKRLGLPDGGARTKQALAVLA